MTTSTNGGLAWDDPRLTVFIIWGVFIFIVFFCVPSKRLVHRVCRRFAIRCCGYEEESGNDPNAEHGGEVLWDLLSPARKLEIDSLRASHISYRLHSFSLTLEKKHMLTEESTTSSLPSSSSSSSSSKILIMTTPSSSSSKPIIILPQDEISSNGVNNFNTEEEFSSTQHLVVVNNNSSSDETKNDKISISNNKNNNDANSSSSDQHHYHNGQNESEEEEKDEERKQEEQENIQYTHILIPPPGHNFDGIDVTTLSPSTDKMSTEDFSNAANTSNADSNYFRMRLFGGKTKVKINKDDNAKHEEEGDEENNHKNSRKSNSSIAQKELGKSKVCSNVCTICLMEYEISDRVSWSSNPECTHVFHEDCIVHWLVSLGRTKSKMSRFSEEPTEAQLLNYELDCPCCRQVFIPSSDRICRGVDNV